jgi:hypothetical protein
VDDHRHVERLAPQSLAMWLFRASSFGIIATCPAWGPREAIFIGGAMTTDSFFVTMVVAMLALFFGAFVAFLGYRLFLFLIPIFGFFWGFVFGAQAVQAIFGSGFLADLTSWVTGFFVGLVFAALSYLFYFAAVALIGGALGYSIGTGLLMAIGFDFGLIVWIAGFLLGVVLAILVIVLNVQKWVVIAATSLLGAGIIITTFLFLFGNVPSQQILANPVRVSLNAGPFWVIAYLVLAAVAVLVQFQTGRLFQLEEYNRYEAATTTM